MFGAFAKWFGNGVFFVLVVIGAIFFASNVSGWIRGTSGHLPVVAPVVSPVAVVAPVAAAGVESCPCDAGLVCAGPRGGRYCITAAGGKKYL